MVANVGLWRSQFQEVWEPLSMEKKIIWILFLNHTVAILTLLEFVFLRKH